MDYKSWNEEYKWGTNTTIVLDKCIGAVDIQYDNYYPDWGFICDITVNPDDRNKGYGSYLVKLAEEDIIKHNLKLSKLSVEKKDWLVDWYKKLGYTIIHKDEDYYYMIKVLK